MFQNICVNYNVHKLCEIYRLVEIKFSENFNGIIHFTSNTSNSTQIPLKITAHKKCVAINFVEKHLGFLL